MDERRLIVVGSSSPPALIHRYDEHVAAVKALAWSPIQSGLLASGGGTADRTIRFWSVKDAEGTASIRHLSTSSQVCNMVWSPHSMELVSTHGFTDHHVLRWSYSTGRKAKPLDSIIDEPTAIMTGHQMRVLHLCISPDGRTIVTGSADETLRFWPAFNQSHLSANPYCTSLKKILPLEQTDARLYSMGR